MLLLFWDLSIAQCYCDLRALHIHQHFDYYNSPKGPLCVGRPTIRSVPQRQNCISVFMTSFPETGKPGRELRIAVNPVDEERGTETEREGRISCKRVLCSGWRRSCRRLGWPYKNNATVFALRREQWDSVFLSYTPLTPSTLFFSLPTYLHLRLSHLLQLRFNPFYLSFLSDHPANCCHWLGPTTWFWTPKRALYQGLALEF